ncbi:hypothetical protein N9518_03485 [Candidatus Pelagibacter sp.]|nr:hypothetical protein [Candidatus Pelagibacter sp.]
MNKNFFEFIKKNKNLINQTKSNKEVLIVDRNRFGSALFSTLITSALNKKYFFNVRLLSNQVKKSNFIKFYKSFGVNNIIYKNNFFDYLKDYKILVQTVYYFTIYSFKIYISPLSWLTNRFKLKGVKIGDLIYDSWIKNKLNFINKKKNIRLFILLFFTIYKFLKVFNLLKRNKIKTIIVSTASYANYDSLAIRIGLKFKIRVLEAGYFKNKNSILEYNYNHLKYGMRNIYHDKKQKNYFNNLNISENLLDHFIKKRFSNKIKLLYTNNSDVKLANNLNTNYTKKEFIKKFSTQKDYDKIILVALHAFSDAPHGAGYDLMFTDYYSFYSETLNEISKSKENILFIIRPHPASKLYGEKGIAEHLLKKRHFKNIILCPNVTTQNLILICDTVITMKGTIGLEFAVAGKKPITCGYPAYSNMGITKNFHSKKNLFLELQKLSNKDFNLSKKKVHMAKRLLFYLETCLPFKEFESSQFFQDILLDINNIKSDLIWKKLSERFNNKVNFSKDKFYLDCLRKL